MLHVFFFLMLRDREIKNSHRLVRSARFRLYNLVREVSALDLYGQLPR